MTWSIEKKGSTLFLRGPNKLQIKFEDFDCRRSEPYTPLLGVVSNFTLIGFLYPLEPNLMFGIYIAGDNTMEASIEIGYNVSLEVPVEFAQYLQDILTGEVVI